MLSQGYGLRHSPRAMLATSDAPERSGIGATRLALRRDRCHHRPVQLGIDFGTTRTVVACADRGNHPVVCFTDASGDTVAWIPSVVAERDGELRYGLDAVA